MVKPHDILAAMIQHCDLAQNNKELNSLDWETRVVDPLASAGFEFDFDQGASKGVLIFMKEGFVIKVPFQAYEYDEGSYCDALEAYDRGDLDEEPMIEDYVGLFYNANNFFLETENDWDYCALECAVFQEAQKEGLDPYFAKETLLGEVRGYPIYVQQLVVPYAEAQSSRPNRSSEEERSRAREFCNSFDQHCFNEEWIADFLGIYGEDEFKRLCAFLKKLKIYDLHRGNVGYLDGYPILLDYSNYNE